MTGPKNEAPGAVASAEGQWTCRGESLHSTEATTKPNAFELVPCKEERRADSRLLAGHLGIPHRSVFKLLNTHIKRFKQLGKVRFEIAASAGSRTGQTEKYAMLNEDQSYLMLTFSRNSERVADLKVKLIQAFGEARRAAEMRKAEYLPGYHAAHDAIHALAAGSENERFIHMNFNRLVNKVAGIESGQRSSAALPQQALMTVAQMAATQAMQGATDHKDGYKRAKRALEPFLALTQAQAASPQLAGQESCHG